MSNGKQILDFVMNHPNGGNRVLESITKALNDGAIKQDECVECLHWVYQDMQQEDSFFNREGECNIELHTSEVINMFLMAKYQFGLYGKVDDSHLTKSGVKSKLP